MPTSLGARLLPVWQMSPHKLRWQEAHVEQALLRVRGRLVGPAPVASILLLLLLMLLPPACLLVSGSGGAAHRTSAPVQAPGLHFGQVCSRWGLSFGSLPSSAHNAMCSIVTRAARIESPASSTACRSFSRRRESLFLWPFSWILASSVAPESSAAPAAADRDLQRKVLLLHPDSGLPGFVKGIGSTSWSGAAVQFAKRVNWDLDGLVELHTQGLTDFCQEAWGPDSLRYGLVLGIDLPDLPADCLEAARALLEVPARVFVSSFSKGGSGSGSSSRSNSSSSSSPFWLRLTTDPDSRKQARLFAKVAELWHRQSEDEAILAVLMLIDTFITPLPSVQAQRPVPSFKSILRTATNCNWQILGCLSQPRCIRGMLCLVFCGLADQACAYRCLLSFESVEFMKLSLCALERQNVLNSNLQMPESPKIAPPANFRKAELTLETADNILVGHFNPSQHGQNYSWLVAASSSSAYAQFRLQHQLWYHGPSQRSFLYHPTFLVEALNSSKIWRTRDYKVARTKTAGEWEFSALDNGIFLKERWQLLGADDELRWAAVFFTGVAQNAGQAYRGCMLLTKDGLLPNQNSMEQLEATISRAGLQLWELVAMDNSPADQLAPPPLISPKSQPPSPLLQNA
ncbi:unnamed protein product [Polarella glacialis]|uniref:VDE lipocalin domain-containing protein n=1 Tax=Polarella glacialis TaxID=89957 RepID=A0A813GJC6_POLGL|nr:unnamed protein product [Polarella glacialis]